MPATAAEKLANALERMRDRSLSEQEHEVAVEQFVEANAVLLDKLGVERRGSTTTLLGLGISLVLVVAVVVSMVFSVTQAVDANQAADSATESARRVQAQAERLHSIQRENVFSNRANCERGNDSRVAGIKNLHGDVDTLTAERNLWVAALSQSTAAEKAALEGTPVGEALDANLSALAQGIHRKETAIERAINSQSKVAIKPGSPRADCSLAFPLAGEKTVRAQPPSR